MTDEYYEELKKEISYVNSLTDIRKVCELEQKIFYLNGNDDRTCEIYQLAKAKGFHI